MDIFPIPSRNFEINQFSVVFIVSSVIGFHIQNINLNGTIKDDTILVDDLLC